MRIFNAYPSAVFAILISVATFNAKAGRDDLLQMVTGQQRIVSAPGVTRIAIGNPAVADVKVVSPGEVLVTATGDGQTELTIWRGTKIEKYEVIVTTMDPKQIKREIERMLGDREGIQVRAVRDQIFIEGMVLTLSDLEKAEEVSRAFPNVRNAVKLDPSAHTHIAASINNQLAQVGLTKTRATVV